MSDGGVVIKSKDDEEFSGFCVADNRHVTCSCSDISALPELPEWKSSEDLGCIGSTEFTTFQATTTELTTLTSTATGTVSVSSPRNTTNGVSDPRLVDKTTGDPVTPSDNGQESTTVEVSGLSTNVPPSQQSATTPSFTHSGSATGKSESLVTDRGSSSSTGTYPGLLHSYEGSSTLLDGSHTPTTQPDLSNFTSDVVSDGIRTELVTRTKSGLISLTHGSTMLPPAITEPEISSASSTVTRNSTVTDMTAKLTTDGTENPNAALIIGVASLGGLLLIVVALILFYKFYYKPKKSRSLTVTPTSGGSPQEVDRPSFYHDPDKSYVELNPANTLQAWDGKKETKPPNVKTDGIDGKNSPSALPPVVVITQGGGSDTTKPKNKKKKKKKKKASETDEPLRLESPVIGNGNGELKEVIT